MSTQLLTNDCTCVTAKIFSPGTPILDLGNFLNIAGDGTATQSSTGWNGVPGRAIDGDISMKYNK